MLRFYAPLPVRRLRARRVYELRAPRRSSFSSSSASDSTALRNVSRWSDSFGLCAFACGSSTPVTRICAPGNSRTRSAMNGIEPPTPMSTDSTP